MWNDFFEYMKFTDGIATSDVLGWILALFGAYFVYRLIDHMQTSMERHSMLRDIEASLSELYDQPIAKSKQEKLDSLPPNISFEQYKINLCENVMVRSVLHDFTNWEPKYDNEHKLICEIVDTQRFLLIRNNQDKNNHYYEWISTQALHEILLVSRRIEKMYKDGIIKPLDLADMSHEIIPLGMSGRIKLLSNYYGHYDAECVAYLVMMTVVACYRHKNIESVNTFRQYYQEYSKELSVFFVKSVRIRKIRDLFKVRKFKKLMRNGYGE